MTRLCPILIVVTTACGQLHVMQSDQAPVAKKTPRSKRDWIQKSGAQGPKYEINVLDVEPWEVWTFMGGMALLTGGLIWWLLSDGSPDAPPPPRKPAPRPSYDDMDLDEIFDRPPADPVTDHHRAATLGPIGR